MTFKKPGLTAWIGISFVLGVLYGWLVSHFPAWENATKTTSPHLSSVLHFLYHSTYLDTMSSMFIRLIKLIVVPLVFSSIVVGFCSASGKHMGRLFIKAIVWFWLATAVALAVGLTSAYVFKPGVGASQKDASYKPAQEDTKPIPFTEQLTPASIVDAMAKNQLVGVLVFSILFGLGLSATGARGKPLLDVLEATSETMFKVTKYIMYMAPIGVFGAIAKNIKKSDFNDLKRLAMLVGSLYIALIVFVVILLTALKLLTKIRIKTMLQEIKGHLFLTFSTASSESVLPRVMASMERLGVPSRIVRMTIPLGYTFNLDGSTLYLSLAAMFIAQAAAPITGVYLTLGQQLAMMFTLLLTSKGVAAVPRASLVVLAATCASFNLPVSWIGTILAVDVLMDMARSCVNVLGNCTASVIVAKWENDLPATSAIFHEYIEPAA